MYRIAYNTTIFALNLYAILILYIIPLLFLKKKNSFLYQGNFHQLVVPHVLHMDLMRKQMIK